MVYTPNKFTTRTLCFLIRFKMKEQQQCIYFRIFRKEKLWRNVKSSKHSKHFLTCLLKSLVSILTSFCSIPLTFFRDQLENKHKLGNTPVIDGLGDFVSELLNMKENPDWSVGSSLRFSLVTSIFFTHCILSCWLFDRM